MAHLALHGVNLSGWLTLESWVTPGLFAPYAALDEPALVEALGKERYQELVRAHRARFIGQDDFSRIAARGFNAVRLPVPWYVFGEDGPTPGPYLGCIELVDEALNWAEEIDLKIIFVLAISPGAAATDDAGSYKLSDLRNYSTRVLTVLKEFSKRYASRLGFFGIELADEVHVQRRRGLSLRDGVSVHTLRTYYRDAYEVVRTSAGKTPVVIMPDAADPELWRRFMAQRHYSNVWLDCDISAYTSAWDATGPSGIRTLIHAYKEHLEHAHRCGVPTMVGRWSAHLPYADSQTTNEGRVALERIFVSEQLHLLKRVPAWFFQTWKTETLLTNWDGRIALAPFERGMLS